MSHKSFINIDENAEDAELNTLNFEDEAIGRDGESVSIGAKSNCFTCCTCTRRCTVGYRGECDECGLERCYYCATGSQKHECTRTERKSLLITKLFAKIEIRKEDCELFNSYSIYNFDGKMMQKVDIWDLRQLRELKVSPSCTLSNPFITLDLPDSNVLPILLQFNKCEDDLTVFITLVSEEGKRELLELCLNSQDCKV